MYLHQFSCYAGASSTHCRPVVWGDNCTHLNLSITFDTGVKLCSSTGTNFFPCFLEQWEAVKLGSLEKTAGIEAHCR